MIDSTTIAITELQAKELAEIILNLQVKNHNQQKLIDSRRKNCMDKDEVTKLFFVKDASEELLFKGLTPFGRAFRDMRIDKGLRLYDVANLTGFSSSEISGIDIGSNKLAPQVIDFLANIGKITAQEADNLKKLYYFENN